MRFHRLFPGFCLLFSSMTAMAAPDGNTPENQAQVASQALADTCAKVACRKQTRSLTLRASGGNVVRFGTGTFPYLDTKGQIVIYPGETITLTMASNGNGPPSLMSVTDQDGAVDIGKPASGDSTLSFSFIQVDGKPDMMLIATNGVAAIMKYDAVMFAATSNGIRPSQTSICPVFPPQDTAKTFSGIEHWPYPITMMVLSNIRALGAGDDKACK